MVSLLFCIFALLLPWSDGACDEGWSQQGNTCFYFSHTAATTSYSWHRARQFCRDQGAELASIHTEEEQKLIFDLASNASYRGGVWLGYNNLAHRGSPFSWSDGTNGEYIAWSTGEPAAQDDQRCAYTDTAENQACFDVYGNTTILPTSMKDPRKPPSGCRYLKQIYVDVRPNCRNFCKARRTCDYYIAYLNSHDIMSFRGACIECSKSGISKERHDEFAEYGEKRQCKDEFWHTANCGELKGFMCRKEVNSGAPPTIAPTPEVPGYCPHGFKGFGNKCYKVVTDEELSWADAVQKCRQEPGRDADLAAINSPQEEAAVTLWLQDGVRIGVWLGGAKINGNWVWSDNSDPAYQHWGGHSDYYCMFLEAARRPLGSWSSTYCTRKLGYVCQTYKDPSHVQSTPGVPTPHPCPGGYTPYWYGCYKLQESQMTWYAAESACVADGGHLVSMVSEAENAFVYSFAQKGLPLWIGLRLLSGEYQWTDGWPEVYTNWGPGQPATNLGCVLMDAGGTWNDTGCYHSYRSICKITTVDTPTTPKPAEGSCPAPAFGRDWLEFGGHCYYFSPNSVRGWKYANDECKRLPGPDFNATLASVHNRVTNEWFQSYISDKWPYRDGTYLGLQRNREGNSVWSWADGSPANYFRWAPGEPSNEAEECVELLSKTWNGLWNDIDCNQYRPYVCMAEKANNCDKENGWHHYKDMCYFVSNTAELSGYSWHQARDYCHQQGAELASIADLEENAKIMDYGVEGRYRGVLWHGYNSLSTQGNDWEWEDGTNSSFTGWANYQPDTDGLERCAYVRPNAYNPEFSWNSENCAVPNGFVCKKDPDNPVLPTVRPTEEVPGFCPPGYHGYSNKCYKLVEREVSDGFLWQDARTECKADGFGADLASLTTPIEQAVVVSMLGNPVNGFWIGIRQKNYKLNWVNNAELGYTNFPDTIVSGQILCGELLPYTIPPGTWRKSSCYAKRGYICEAYKDMAHIQPSSEPLPTTDCAEGFTAHNNGCYKLELIPRTWSAADLFCKKKKANLASIRDLTENSYLLAVAQNVMPIWIGLQNVAGEYKWTDGWPDLYTNWAPEEPTGGEGCVIMDPDSKWNDTSCHLERPFFCKTTKEPIPTTPSPAEGICPDEDWQEWGGHCFFFSAQVKPYPQQMTWSRAHERCGELAGRAHRGALASIHDDVTNEWVRRNMYYDRAVRSWIGLQKSSLDDVWTWDDGSAVSYVNFLNDKVAEYEICASMNVDSFMGKWVTDSCNYYRTFVCKAEKVPYPTTPTVPPEVAGECPSEEWTSVGAHCFLSRPSDYVPWVEAVSKCKAEGGESLATVSDSAENWFLHQALQADMDSSEAVWIGLSQKSIDDDWKWLDGTELSFTNWYNDKPLTKGRCVTLQVSTGEWVTKDCLTNAPYVCKYTKKAVVTTAHPATTEEHHDDDEPSTLSPAALTGVVLGVLAAFALLGGVSFLIIHFRKRRLPKDENSFDNHNYETMKNEK